LLSKATNFHVYPASNSTYNFQRTDSIQNIQWIETLANKKHTYTTSKLYNK